MKDLDFDSDSLFFIVLFCGNHSLKLKSKLRAGNAVFDLFGVHEVYKGAEIVQRFARGEELGEVVHVARSILFDFE